jgi:preprotein translocase subunit SecG
MLRVLGIPAVLVVVLLVVYLSLQEMKSNGPTSATGRQAITQAQSEVAATNLAQAAAAMQAFYAENGTYVGATLPVGSGVVLVTAAPSSYCLQAGGEHEVGPNGQLAPGAC